MSSIQQTAALVIEQTFSHPFGTGGFVPFVAATDGLTGQQAATVPATRINSVWAVANHLTFLQDMLRSALVGELTEILADPSASWPPLGEISDANWQAARQRTLDSNHQLSQAVAALPDAQLGEALPGFFNVITEQAILIITGHISYHTAEIVTIRHMHGLWVEHQFA